MTLELHATPEEVMRAVDAMRDFARTQQIPEPAAYALALVLEECGSNIVNHALQRDARQTFRVTIERAGSEVVIELRDHGPEFDPTQVVGRPATGDEPPGGWGIQLVRRYADGIRYRRQAGENVLRLTKRLVPAAGGR